MVPQTRWAETVDGASIAYHDLGEGSPVVVLINGWVSHLEVYWEQPRFVRFMRRLSQNLRVLVFDKRGMGMSDRLMLTGADLEVRMDDVRAVLDAAAVERAALLGWGTGGAPLAFFFAASNPERTLAVCTDGNILEKRVPGYPWGRDEESAERKTAELMAVWGVQAGLAERTGDSHGAHGHTLEPEFHAWFAKLCRYAATPKSFAVFDRLWWETDVRDILGAVQTPTAVFYKKDAPPSWGNREQAQYLAERVPASRLLEIPGTAPNPFIEEPHPLVSAIEQFIESVEEEEAEFDRVLATVVFTDIVGSTKRVAELGDRHWKELLERHHQAIRAMLGRYRGTEVDTAGDGFFATFDGPARAVRCAQAIAAAVRPLGIEVRAGVHTGEIEYIGDKVAGMAVHIGARVGALAAPSEVLVSSTVHDLVVGSGLTFTERGVHQLKGIPGEWRLYKATEPGTSPDIE